MSLQTAAEAVRQKGRGDDTMLIHMTPDEVGGLQQLAMAYGGSLTVNPETGLPEAGFLKSLLPTLVGAGLMMIPGVNAIGAGLMVGGVEAARTGDLGKGLMAGLGAYGGANLAGAATSAGQAAGAQAAQLTPQQVAQQTAQAANVSPVADVGRNLSGLDAAIADANAKVIGGFSPAASSAATSPLQSAMAAGSGTYTPATTVAGRFAEAGSGIGNILGTTGTEATQAAARSAGMEALGGSATSAAMKGAAALAGPLTTPAPMPKVAQPEESNYDGPYVPTERQVRYPGPDRDPADSSEFQYFDVVNPTPGFQTMASATPSTVDLSGEPTFAGIPISLATNTDRLREYQANPDLYQFAEGGAAGVKAAPASYKAGVDPEFNYGFQPMANVPSTQGQGANGLPGFKTQSLSDLQAAGGIGSGSGFAGTNLTASQLTSGFRNQFLKHPTLGPQLRAAGYYAEGGKTMDDGGFVVDAHTVSEIGNGSSDAGHERLAKIGGEPIEGPGDGVSDSIKANIGGVQEARIARDESYLSKEDVKALGDGDIKKGEKMLYTLMRKAHESRKNKGRGEATGLDKLIARMA